MTRRLLLAALTMAALPAVAAHGGDGTWPSPEGASERLAEMKERLKLTPEQEEPVRAILQEEIRRARAVLEKYEGQPRRRRTKLKMTRELKAIADDADKRLAAVLTPPQMAELERLRAEHKKRLKEVR
jgi:Spy/CpxP family protein refolding chaperone